MTRVKTIHFNTQDVKHFPKSNSSTEVVVKLKFSRSEMSSFNHTRLLFEWARTVHVLFINGYRQINKQTNMQACSQPRLDEYLDTHGLTWQIKPSCLCL